MNFVSPLSGRLISWFGAERDGGARSHAGIDIAAPTGSPVQAIAAGRVSRAGNLSSTSGLAVVIEHGAGVVSKYMHLSRVSVSAGQ